MVASAEKPDRAMHLFCGRAPPAALTRYFKRSCCQVLRGDIRSGGGPGPPLGTIRNGRTGGQRARSLPSEKIRVAALPAPGRRLRGSLRCRSMRSHLEKTGPQPRRTLVTFLRWKVTRGRQDRPGPTPGSHRRRGEPETRRPLCQTTPCAFISSKRSLYLF